MTESNDRMRCRLQKAAPKGGGSEFTKEKKESASSLFLKKKRASVCYFARVPLHCVLETLWPKCHLAMFSKVWLKECCFFWFFR